MTLEQANLLHNNDLIQREVSYVIVIALRTEEFLEKIELCRTFTSEDRNLIKR
jgi:hypothetical protein